MVNLFLTAVAVLTLVVWLAQELFGRRQHERRVLQQLQQGGNGVLALGEVALEPTWSDWAFRLVAMLWIGWVICALLVKDGDFAFVLVILTLLAGLIALLDRFVFQSRRDRFAASDPVAGLLQRVPPPQDEVTRNQVAGEWAIAEYSRSFFPVLAVVLVLRSFVVEPFQIPSSSMVPTLEVGDFILVNKFTYGLRLPVLRTKLVELGQPQRGDVMVFFPPDDDRYFIKRVVGLPGDRIEYRNKQLTINGQPAPQTLLAELPPSRPRVELAAEKLGETEHLINKSRLASGAEGSWVVEPGHYFMMGDNRDNSHDSRYWGQVPERNIVGKAFAIWMHFESFRELPSFDRVGAIH